VLDLQLGTRVAPGTGFVAAAIVCQHTLHVDASCAKPAHRALQDADGNVGGFVVVDLGIGHPRVVIDDGMDERVPKTGLATAVCDARGGRTVFMT
jgi:hypothetical protein